mmetsp:Transcript_26433/g.63718  ORF Transcript_26433/g.63718 Transcript_26433/m.63718 type:complete len:227 (+) Transcript_26433:5479-6159(+)
MHLDLTDAKSVFAWRAFSHCQPHIPEAPRLGANHVLIVTPDTAFLLCDRNPCRAVFRSLHLEAHSMLVPRPLHQYAGGFDHAPSVKQKALLARAGLAPPEGVVVTVSCKPCGMTNVSAARHVLCAPHVAILIGVVTPPGPVRDVTLLGIIDGNPTVLQHRPSAPRPPVRHPHLIIPGRHGPEERLGFATLGLWRYRTVENLLLFAQARIVLRTEADSVIPQKARPV